MISATAREILGFLAIIIGIFGDCAYVWTILRGKTRPHAFSWLLWMLVALVVLPGQFMAHAGPGMWLTTYNIGFCGLVFKLSLIYGEVTYTRDDIILLVIALAGIPVLLLSPTPAWSICLETAITLIAGLPTIRKSYHQPFSENILSYAVACAAFIANLLAMAQYSFATLIFPAAAMCFNAGLAAMLLGRRRVLRRA